MQSIFNKYLTKLQLPIIALTVIFLVYGFLTIRDLNNKTSDLKKQNQDLVFNINQTSSELVSLKNDVNATSNQLATAQKQISSASQTSKQAASSTFTAAPTIITKTITQTANQQVALSQATVTIENIGSFKVGIENNDTAFSVLKKAASQNGFNITYDEYSFGAFLTSIGEIKPSGNQFWAFYYNGAFSNIGASAQPIQENDNIFWQLASW